METNNSVKDKSKENKEGVRAIIFTFSMAACGYITYSATDQLFPLCATIALLIGTITIATAVKLTV